MQRLLVPVPGLTHLPSTSIASLVRVVFANLTCVGTGRGACMPEGEREKGERERERERGKKVSKM